MAPISAHRRGRAVALIALLVAVVAALPAVGQADERPNFLHILTDDQTIDSLEYMAQTERLLGGRGTDFTNYHDTQPLCCPSRASFLTGQYPHNHGVLDNLPPYGYGAMDFSRTIYTALHDSGYRTGWVGKVLNGVEDEGLVPAPGFDDWLVPLANTEHDMFNYTLSDNGTARSLTGTYQNDVYADRARSFIASHGDQPFLLTLALFSPHWNFCPGGLPGHCPPAPAPADLGTFAGQAFPFGPGYKGSAAERAIADTYWQRELESLQSVDRIVAALVEQLRAQGELDNTFIIFQSDNGLEHGEHGIFDKNVAWDRSVRVPLLIRGPGFARGKVRDDLTANVDVPATILDAAGVAPPLPLDGYSLLSDHRRRFLLLERLHGGTSRLQQPWRQIKTASGWTYWRDLISGHRHLYDLDRDPYQLHNRVTREPHLVHKLQRRMSRFADCANPCP
ncbi:MAG: sulfatase [Solirubrobacterales bacterium]|nr:sulfatase [Solirubrobacterales bacterium]